MSITYRKATPSDARNISILVRDAMLDDLILNALYPKHSEFTEDYIQDYTPKTLRKILQKNWAVIVAEVTKEDGSKALVGLGTWERTMPKDESREPPKRWTDMANSGAPMLQDLELKLFELQDKVFKPFKRSCRAVDLEWTKYWADLNVAAGMPGGDWAPYPRRYYLGLLCIHPDYRRRGIGTYLVRWGMECAKEEGCVTLLSASEMGKKVYDGLGWKVIKTWTLKDVGETPLMMWNPNWEDGDLGK